MSTLAARIQDALDHSGISWSKAATSIGLSAQAATKWKRGQISKETLKDLSQFLNVDYTWLATGEGDMTTRPTTAQLQAKINEIQGKVNGVECANPIKLVPIINSVQAGHFTGVGDDSYDEWEASHHKDGDYWLKVKGDSMMPDFHQGDLILVGKERKAVTGNYVVAMVDGSAEATFKKYRECFEGEPYFELIALNNFYPTIDSRTKHFEVIGVVLEHKRVLV